MEMYEENCLWEYWEILRKKWLFIAAIVLVSLIFGYLLASFWLPGSYKTEVWLKNNRYFTLNGSKLSQESLKTYFLYPEVIVRSEINGNGFIDDSIFKLESLDNDIFHLTFIHGENPKIIDTIKRWIMYSEEKLVSEVISDLLTSIDNDYYGTQVSIDLQQKRLEILQELVQREGKYVDIEVVPQESFPPEKIVVKELNSNYVKLTQEMNSLEQQISDLQERRVLIEDFLSKLTVLAEKVKKGNVDEDELLKIDNEYTAYLQQIKESSTRGSLIPYFVVSGPHTNPNSLSLSTINTIVLTGTLTFFVSICFVILTYQRKNYLEANNRT